MVTLLPSNIGILTACLKEADIETKLFDTTYYRTDTMSLDEIRIENSQLRQFDFKNKGVDYKESNIFEDFRKTVHNFKPDIIAITATDDTYDLGIDLVSKVKDQNIFTIVGGIYATFSPENVINNENVNAICIGEGEKALVELCQKMAAGEDITKIRNLWVKTNGMIHKNSTRELINVDKIPFEDFSLFEDSRLYRPMQGKMYRMIPVTIDRGCPFNCTYCAAPSQRKLYKENKAGNYFRVKSPSRVINELKHQVDKHKANYVYFNSETFLAKRENIIEEFGKKYSATIGLPFWCQTRVETITEKRIKILQDMNCDRISLGLEHGNEEFRKKMLNKHFKNEDVIKAFKILEKSKIPITVNNIVGFPDETRELAFDTIKLNRQITADTLNALFFVPYTGTPLRQYCIDKGYIDSNTKTDSCIKRSVLNMPNFTAREIKGIVRTFPLYVKMPESYYDKIKVAEQLNEEGDKMHFELTQVFKRDHLK